MLLPIVDLHDPTRWNDLCPLRIICTTCALMPLADIDSFVSVEALTDEQLQQKRLLCQSRTILGTFTWNMMECAAKWLDQGVGQILVKAESQDSNEFEKLATAVSELPNTRVIIELQITTEDLIINESASLNTIKQQIESLQKLCAGFILSITCELSTQNMEVIENALIPLRKLLSEEYLFGVRWISKDEALIDPQLVLSQVATLHTKAIAVAAVAKSPSELENEFKHDVNAAECLVACMKSDRKDGLFTTIVVDEGGVALGLVYSSKDSILYAIASGRGVYYSRSRQGLWKKGESSGNTQKLLQLDLDCDSDALRFMVEQTGAGFCHLNTRTCWGPAGGLRQLQSTLESRLKDAPEGSYTQRLFRDPTLLRNKLVEEAQELAEAETKTHVAEEAADVFYFAMTRCVAAGVTLKDVESQLDKKALKVKRRPGNSKEYRIEAANAILNQQKSL